MRLMNSVISALAVALVTVAPAMAETPAAGHRLVLTGAGRFALFADVATIRPDGDGVRMRVLQVAEAGFAVGDTLYWGGWSWWRFDCAAQTADRLDFASLREDGVEGPAMPDNAPAYPAAPGGDAAELLAVACAAEPPAPDAVSIAAAVALGRAELAD